MKTFSILRTLCQTSLVAGLLASLLTPVRAAPGEADFTFGGGMGGASSIVETIALQPDGKILAGGSAAPYMKRFNANGTTDASFNASLALNNWVTAIEPAADGKIYAGGNFTAIGGGARSLFARLNSNGTLDSSFTLTSSAEMKSMAFQPDGKALMGGFQVFSRITTSDTFEAGFGGADSTVQDLAVFPNGQMLAAGSFSTIAGVSRKNASILSATGVPTAFNPRNGLGGLVYQSAVLPDGRILLLEWVSPSFRIYRYNPDGTRDTSYNATFDNQAYDMALQCDGKVIIVGFFSAAGGSYGKMARFNADGTLDTTFYNNAGNTQNFKSVALQADGKILVGGSFTGVGGGGTARFARLLNDPATSTLTNTPSRVEWLRGGSAPEAQWVQFDQSTDGGANWTLLGLASRISGGWELTGQSIPAGALVRGRAFTRDGFVQQAPSFPEIVLEQPTNTNLVDGTASIAYGSVFTGSSSSKTFTIKNTGSAALSVTGVSVTGGNAGDFTVSAPSMPLNVPVDSSETFTVSFNPTVGGSRTTTLQILSNDADEATFDIALTGTGVLAPEIAVEHPVGTDVPRFSFISFGNVTVGASSASKTFTLKNTGLGVLNVTSMTMSSGHNADFILSTPTVPFSVAASGSVTFTTTFSPTAIGARSAYITIQNNDADETPFYIQTTGTGLEVVDSAPVITSPLTGNAFVPFFYNYQMTATDIPSSFTASGLPAGLSLDAATGVISGIPSVTGVFNIQLSATNAGFGAGPTATLVLTITNPNLPYLTAIELPPTAPISLTGTWMVQTAVTHDGVDALTNSPNWFDFGRLTLPIQGPATFSCWWKANSGDASNTAWIRLDGFFGTVQSSISAENSPWRFVEFAIPAGSHDVEFTMDRFSNTFSSASTIWLDQVTITYPSPDADTDGLPDAWEITHFGSAGATTGTADADGDGLNNFGEYAFGLNPNSGNLSGLPQPTKVGGLLTMTVTKQPFVNYTVVSSTDLAASFTTTGLTIVTDTATTLTVRETAASTRNFMKVLAVPAP